MWEVMALAALAADPEAPPSAALVAAPDPDQTVGLRLSVLPGVGIGAAPDAHVEGFAVGGVSRAASLSGVDAELGFGWVAGPVEGVQLALGANVADDVRGFQLALGLNWAQGEAEVFQGAWGANVARGTLTGAQGATFLNVAVAGGDAVQATAGVNVAGDLRGVQAAPLNVARSVDGLQLGLVNVARDAKGVQLGLVNVAKTSEVSIAPINLIGDGLHRLDVWTSESSVGSAGLKFGSRYVYTLLGAGLVAETEPWFTWGGGFGVHLPKGPLWLEADATAWGLSQGQVVAPGGHGKLRAQVGVDVLGHLAPFAGVSMNTWLGDGSVWPEAVGLPSSTQAGRRVVTWPGFHAGVSFF